jgi:3-dehydroquinate dehydratase-1
MAKIGTLLLGDTPRIAAIVDEVIPVEDLKPLVKKADLLEMRIDCWQRPIEQVTAYLREVRSATALPMIGTIRENDFTRTIRLEMFRAVIPLVDAVDIELGTPISTAVTASAKGITVIVSEHDFATTPPDGVLQSMAERSCAQGADIVKIAAMANCREDVVRLLEFTRSSTVPVVAIAMGPLGTVSRVIAPLFGSLFTYGYLTRPVAPGQLSLTELAEAVGRYFPET